MAASNETKTGNSATASKKDSARRDHDFVTLGIAIAAVILFVGTAGVAVPTLLRSWLHSAPSPDLILTNALLLNIALILLGWNRLKALNNELDQRRQSEEEARRLADIDHLTGCHNRRSFTAALGEMLVDRIGNERALAAIALDLDNFKQVNDLNGHQAGDEVLRSTASRVLKLLPEGALLARLGGDEFVCVVPYHPQVPDRIDQLATRIIGFFETVKPQRCLGNSLGFQGRMWVPRRQPEVARDRLAGRRLIGIAVADDIAQRQLLGLRQRQVVIDVLQMHTVFDERQFKQRPPQCGANGPRLLRCRSVDRKELVERQVAIHVAGPEPGGGK